MKYIMFIAKKIVYFALIVTLSFLVSSCNKGQSAVGYYQCKDSSTGFIDLLSMDVREDGKAYLVTKGFGKSSEIAGNYEVDSNKFVLSVNNNNVVGAYTENQIIFNSRELSATCNKMGDDPSEKIIGKWTSNGHGLDFQVNKDSSLCNFKSSKLECNSSWKLKGDNFYIIDDSDEMKFTIKFNGYNSFTMKMKGYDKVLTMTRAR